MSAMPQSGKLEEAYPAASAPPSHERLTGAIRSLAFVYQPIVRWSARKVIAHEALVRSAEPGLEGALALFDAARILNRQRELGGAVRGRLGADLSTIQGDLFVNVEPPDLLDAGLYDPRSPLCQNSERVVLEITERASLSFVPEVRRRVFKLRDLGFRIAADDIGADYSGLTNLAVLQPDVVKIDMNLVRNVDREPTRRKVIASLAELCAEMGSVVVAEGVETADERDALVALGCDLLQGHLFARAAGRPPAVRW